MKERMEVRREVRMQKNGRKGIQTNRKNKGKAKEAGKTRKQSKEERRREGTM
jgi:hypothetical protein